MAGDPLTELSGHWQADEPLRRFLAEVTPSPGRVVTEPVLGNTQHSELFDYWQSLPRQAGIPAAADFNPTRILRCLPNISILSLDAPDIISFRLTGTALADRIGLEPRGENMLSFMEEGYRAKCSRDMFEAVLRPCGWQAHHRTRYSSGRTVYVKSSYLPLRAPDGKPPRLVSIHTPEDNPTYEPATGKPHFAGEVLEIVWIDTGHGAPGQASR